MPDEFVEFPIDTDPQDLVDTVYAYIQERVPGWEPHDGAFEVWFIEALANQAAETRDVAAQVPPNIFRYFGETLLGVNPVQASAASTTTTWTMTDTDGHSIPAGTQVGIRSGDDLVLFTVLDTVPVVAGSSATPAGAVTIVAVEEGADASALGSPGADVELIDQLDFVDTIVMVDGTSGGADAESDDDYMDRLSSQLQLLTPRPILPRDFSILSWNVPGVHRAITIDGYKPSDDTSGHERMVAVAAVDESGAPIGSGVKTALDAYLQAQREVSFIVNVFDPTVSAVKVTFTAHAAAGFDHATVQADAIAAVTAYLSAATWGKPQQGNEREWILQDKVRMYEVAQVINNVQGLDYIDTLQIALQANALGVIDITLPGKAPLPSAGTITGTVS